MNNKVEGKTWRAKILLTFDYDWNDKQGLSEPMVWMLQSTSRFHRAFMANCRLDTGKIEEVEEK